jgi:eukaryotic-like serine/threonine-protein kinase
VATSDARDQLQTTLGDAYHIERELPPGGMSRLFLATERSLDRQVVIKLLPPEYASEVSAARFQREVTLTAHLQHPHILPILSAGSREGLLYYVMPYVEGESLRQRLEREGKLPVSAAVQILREVADALARAHKAGIVHRDIKPENILLQDDHALLADFGVARALHEATGNQRLTDTGMGLGTPGYMAPEQLAGERNVDARADVYALAVVGYEMLAGVAPFTGPTPQAVAAAHFTSAPRPLVQLRPEVLAPISTAIGRALAKEPEQRFATAADFREALATAPSRPQGRGATAGRWVAAAAVTFLIIAGVSFGWRRLRFGGSAGASGPVRLAVLPFENLGDSADAYFADGVTDAVRGKLTGVGELEVVGSASSAQYRHTTKTLQQIGSELSVRYLLVGKIRWAKAPGAPSRVEVSPELIDASTAADRWQQPFDAPLTDVFQVQADIATRVAQQLRIALSPTDRQNLNAQPTANIAAYEAYLRGVAIQQAGYGPGIFRRAAAAFEEAIQLDSNFALAWAALADAHCFLYFNGVPKASDAAACRRAGDRALALAPELSNAHVAKQLYYTMVEYDNVRALAEAEAVLRLAPRDPDILTATATQEVRLGRWSAGVAHARQAEVLDPRNDFVAATLASDYTELRRYPEARAEMARARALNPGNQTWVALEVRLYLAQGDLATARAVISAARPSIESPELFVDLTGIADVGVWVLDSAEAQVLVDLPPSAYDDDRASWGIALAEAYALRKDRLRARAYADSALAAATGQVRATPRDPNRHTLRGLALAYLGRSSEAIAEGRRAVALQPISADAEQGAFWQLGLARIYVLVGETEQAIDKLQQLLTIPGQVSAALLRIDPTWSRLRGNPRFERLIAQAH